MRKLVNRHRFVLKCDIRKFFESIDHGILLARLERAVHCAGVRRFEARRRKLAKRREIGRVGMAVRSWYAFSREGNSEGLRRVWSLRR